MSKSRNDALDAAGRWLVATSTCLFSHSGMHDLQRRYASTFIVDEWRESFVDNPACVGNHRSHEAAVNCGIRFAKKHTLLGAQRLEDTHYV